MFRRSYTRRGIAARRPAATPAPVPPVLRVRTSSRGIKTKVTPVAALAFVRPHMGRLC